MTTTLTFGPDEQEEARRAMYAGAAFAVLWTMSEQLRRAARAKNDETAEQQTAAQAWLDCLYNELRVNGIDLEAMYT